MILTVNVKPNAHETKIVGWRDAGTVMIAITAPPVEGKANQKLIDFLADKLNLPITFIAIKRGPSGKVKHLALPDGINLSNIKRD